MGGFLVLLDLLGAAWTALSAPRTRGAEAVKVSGRRKKSKWPLQLVVFSQLLNFGRVAGSVVGDLEAQKGMDRL
jgi:hypothetical protein